jgi:hypothetical protein
MIITRKAWLDGGFVVTKAVSGEAYVDSALTVLLVAPGLPYPRVPGFIPAHTTGISSPASQVYHVLTHSRSTLRVSPSSVRIHFALHRQHPLANLGEKPASILGIDLGVDKAREIFPRRSTSVNPPGAALAPLLSRHQQAGSSAPGGS